MKLHDGCSPSTERRLLLSVIAGSLVVSGLPKIAHGVGDDLHVKAAEKARRLSANGSKVLKLLIPKGCSENVAPVISAFNEMTGILVETTEAAVDDINTQLLLESMTGAGVHDLALPATFGLPDLVSARAIIPLTEYAKKHEPLGFREAVLYNIGDSFDDQIYGFQADGDAYLMFYNREYLENVDEQKRYEDKFGEMLSIPRTWHELDQQLAFFHRPETKQYGGLLFRTAGYLGWEWWVRFHAKGYWPLSPTLEPQINNAAGIQALEEMIQASQYLAPGAESLGLFANWERYSHGDIYCNIGWGGSQKYLNGPKSAIRGKMVYGPTPGGIVDNKLLLTPYFNWGWNYVVTTGSNVPELAYLFALFSSSSIMSTESVRQQGGYFDPFRPEHYQDTEIQRIYSQEFLSVHQDSLKNSIPDLYLANQGQYIQTLNNWLDRALSGAVTATEALNRVAEHWNIINDRSDIRLQQERWRNLRGKYPETVRNLLRDIV